MNEKRSNWLPYKSLILLTALTTTSLVQRYKLQRPKVLFSAKINQKANQSLIESNLLSNQFLEV